MRNPSKNVNMAPVTSTKNPTPCCAPVLHARFGDADAETLANAFKALADPARLKLLSFWKTSQRCRSYMERTHGDDVVLKPYITALNEAARKCQE